MTLRKQPIASRALSDRLSRRLEAALKMGERVDRHFRQSSVKHWAVAFVDISECTEDLWESPTIDPTGVLCEFQSIVQPILERHQATHIHPEGAQVVSCFATPVQAAEASIEIQHAFAARNAAQKESRALVPSIGLHLGDVVYERGELYQSNTCNLAKRVQTQTKPGQIFVSESMYQALKGGSPYPMKFVKETRVKNIPEPQAIYQLIWAEARSGARVCVGKTRLPEAYCEPATIFYIDVCESAKKFWQLGDRLANELIQDYHNFVEPILNKHGCLYQQHSEGDQVMACFPARDPHCAANAAIEIQQALFKRNVRMEERKKMRASIGMHIGEVMRRGREVFYTLDLQIGKEIQDMADADEILISGCLHDLLVKEKRYVMKFVGTTTLPGIPEPQDIYRIIWHSTDKRMYQLGRNRGFENGLHGQSRGADLNFLSR